MRDLVIAKIKDYAIEYGVPLSYWHIDEPTDKELGWCSDEDLVEMLIHVVTFDGEE